MLLDDTADYLAANSTAFTILSGTQGNLAKQRSLDHTPAPDALTVLHETAGLSPIHTFSTSTGSVTRDHERPGLQVLARSPSTDPQAGRDNAETVYTLLDGLAGVVLSTGSGVTYRSIDAVQSPFFLQRDSNDRDIYAVNFNVEKSTG